MDQRRGDRQQHTWPTSMMWTCSLQYKRLYSLRSACTSLQRGQDEGRAAYHAPHVAVHAAHEVGDLLVRVLQLCPRQICNSSQRQPEAGTWLRGFNA